MFMHHQKNDFVFKIDSLNKHSLKMLFLKGLYTFLTLTKFYSLLTLQLSSNCYF